MSRLTSGFVGMVFVLSSAAAFAQGVLIVEDPGQIVRLPRPIMIWPPYPPYPPPHPPHPPRHVPPLPPATYKISEIDVQANLVEQVAQVQVSQSFVNTGSVQLEASFVFPLPYEGAVQQMTFLVDGKEYPARLLKAEEARRIYEETVRKNRDPALLEWLGTGMFKTSVFPVPPGAKRTVSLRYTQLCRKSEGLTDFLFPLSTAKYTSHPPERVAIRVTLESQDDIKNVYSPTHGVEIKRPDAKHAVVSYSARNEVPSVDFRLLYDSAAGLVSARVLSYRPKETDDGYFLLLASPQIKASGQTAQRKTVVFAIDRSGSMSGKKIEQVRGALKIVLNNLREGDLFNIIAYDSQVESFRPELQRYDAQTRQAATAFVESLYAGGSTNIDAALRAAMAQLQDSKQPNYVLFLTDGLPTVGEMNEAKIVANAKEANKVRARVFAFGVGYDVNSRLLDKLVRENFGQSQYVRPDEDIESYVSQLYRRIQTPVMTDVKVAFAFDQAGSDGGAVNRLYPKGNFDLFAGEQLVVVGRYKLAGRAKVTVSGTVDGQARIIDFAVDLAARSADETQAFVEKLWAMRRVGEILDEIDLHGKNSELTRELVELSTRHGILTPYTSFLADENTSVYDMAGNAARAEGRLRALQESSGAGGFYQRAIKGKMQVAEQIAPAAAPMSAAATPLAASRGAIGWAGDVDRETKVAQQNVRNVGGRAFYRRDGQWLDSTLSAQQQAQAVRVKQFSSEYFELARRHGRQMSQYLAFDEPVLLNVQEQAYLIEP